MNYLKILCKFVNYWYQKCPNNAIYFTQQYRNLDWGTHTHINLTNELKKQRLELCKILNNSKLSFD